MVCIEYIKDKEHLLNLLPRKQKKEKRIPQSQSTTNVLSSYNELTNKIHPSLQLKILSEEGLEEVTDLSRSHSINSIPTSESRLKNSETEKISSKKHYLEEESTPLKRDSFTGFKTPSSLNDSKRKKAEPKKKNRISKIQSEKNLNFKIHNEFNSETLEESSIPNEKSGISSPKLIKNSKTPKTKLRELDKKKLLKLQSSPSNKQTLKVKEHSEEHVSGSRTERSLLAPSSHQAKKDQQTDKEKNKRKQIFKRRATEKSLSKITAPLTRRQKTLRPNKDKDKDKDSKEQMSRTNTLGAEVIENWPSTHSQPQEKDKDTEEEEMNSLHNSVYQNQNNRAKDALEKADGDIYNEVMDLIAEETTSTLLNTQKHTETETEKEKEKDKKPRHSRVKSITEKLDKSEKVVKSMKHKQSITKEPKKPDKHLRLKFPHMGKTIKSSNDTSSLNTPAYRAATELISKLEAMNKQISQHNVIIIQQNQAKDKTIHQLNIQCSDTLQQLTQIQNKHDRLNLVNIFFIFF